MDNKFKAFVVIAIITLFATLMAGGYFIVMKISGTAQPVQVQAGNVKVEDIHVMQLTDSITTNLVSEKDEQSNHIIKVTVGFGVNKKSRDYKSIIKQFEEQQLLIRDAVLQSLRDQSYESMTSSDAQSQLAEIILSRVSTLLATQAIEEVYFGEFLVP